MKQLKTLAMLGATAATMWAMPAQANLIVNGDFESGTSPWTTLFGIAAVVPGTNPNGSSGKHLDLGVAMGAVEQTFAVPTAGTYQLSFYAMDTSSVDQSTLGLYISLPSQTVAAFNPNTSWTYYTTTVNLLAGTSQLLISWTSGFGVASLDNISLDLVTVPVPEPTTIIAGALLLLPFGLSTLRVLRNRATTTT